MSVASRKFILKISLFTLIVFVIVSILFSTVLKNWFLPSYPYQLLLIALVTSIGHLLIINASEQNSRKFSTAFLASVTLKLMIYLTFLLVFLLIDHSQVIPFVLTFIIFYVLFTVFEVIEVLNFIKKQSKKSL